MKDLQKMMKQAQKMALEMQKAQAELAEREVTGSAGGGAVVVTASGDLRVLSIEISSEVFEGEPGTDDLEMLADTVTAAVNDALDKARALQEETMGALGGIAGLGLPGM